jgi:hypothetical protein
MGSFSAFDESPTVPFEFGDKGALVMSKMPDTSGTAHSEISLARR